MEPLGSQGWLSETLMSRLMPRRVEPCPCRWHHRAALPGAKAAGLQSLRTGAMEVAMLLLLFVTLCRSIRRFALWPSRDCVCRGAGAPAAAGQIFNLTLSSSSPVISKREAEV